MNSIATPHSSGVTIKAIISGGKQMGDEHPGGYPFFAPQAEKITSVRREE
jgi:hypothetical protein